MNDIIVRQENIECPYCAESIKPAAKKCLHCGEILDAQLRDIQALKNKQDQPNVFMNAGGGGGAAAVGGSGLTLKPFKHWLHIVLSILTIGWWIPVYVLLYLFRNKNLYL